VKNILVILSDLLAFFSHSGSSPIEIDIDVEYGMIWLGFQL
jgi:hypothetical protein